ncbi:MAG: hypothetical protein NTV31_16450 [Bacteroidia bacterium]|nr:hypothetical protein [Bacteroidia bacterium]
MEHFRENKTEYIIGLVLLIPEYILFKFIDYIASDPHNIPQLEFLFKKIEINLVIVCLTLIFLPVIVMKISGFLRKKRGLNSYYIRKLEFQTNNSNPQTSDYKKINLNNSVIRSISMNVEYNCDYIRFGLSLMGKNDTLFSGTQSLIPPSPNFLIHIGRHNGMKKMSTCFYINGRLIEHLNEKVKYHNKSTIKLQLKINNKNLGVFYVNGRKTHFDINLPDTLLEKLYIVAWGDYQYQYSYKVSDIKIESISN